MIALDTNILVRYIVQDDKAQAKKATKAIESIDTNDPAFISIIVLCELNWVLSAAYNVDKQRRIEVLEKMLSADVFKVECFSACLSALKYFKSGKADFSDYVIAQCAKQTGCDAVLTFDKNAAKDGFFKLV